MRFVRAAAIVLLVLCVLALGLAAAIIHNQERLVNAVLHHIEESTGYQIAAAGSRLRFGVHLNLVLEHPRVRHAGRELVNADSIRVVVSYHALIWNNGLPLRRILVIRPQIRTPASSSAFSLAALPRLDNAAVQAMAHELREFSGLVERLTVADARVSDEAGAPLLNEFSLTAAPEHRGSAIWVIGFIAPQIETPLEGLQVSGRTTVNTVARGAGQIASSGELWYWDGRLKQSAAGGITIGGLVHGDLTFVLRADGELDGSANLGVDGLELAGARLFKKLAFGDCSLRTLFAISSQRVALAGIEARVQGTTVMSGNATLSNPYAANAALLTHLGGAQIDLANLKARLGAARELPKQLAELAARLVSGQLVIEGAAYQAPLNKLAWTPAALLGNLVASARLKGVSVGLPTTTGLPALSQIDAQIAYAKDRLTLTQGSATLGRSSFEDVSGEIDLRPGLSALRYRLALSGRLELNEVYPAARRLFPALGGSAAEHIDRLTGTAPVRLTASGALDPEAPAPPADYHVRIETNGFSVAAKGLPQTIALVGGNVTLAPGVIELTRVAATAGKPGTPGNVVLNGSLDFNADNVRPRRISVEMHQIEAQQWLPLLVSPEDVAARGPVGGTLTIVDEPRRRNRIRAQGRLTMGAGEVQLGFLRAPIVSESATLTLDGRGLLLAIMGAKLEGSPLDFSLGVADLDRPVLRIDANAGRLDLEVMKFIRVPWAPSPPAHFLPLPAVGHVVANEANLERLPMSRVSCDFERKANGDWRVYNYRATVYKGHADMELVGRGRDNWLNIKGRVDAMRVGQLFKLADPAATPPLQGRLNAAFDVWADADTDFFDTMNGSISVDVSKGVLHKFALLSRILGLIDLKTWLSAKVPDPRVNGVPFESLTADFKGDNGDFYSDNLLLRGPVMNISAQGNVHLGDGVVDMEVGMVPFKTVNWLVAKVPIIGEGLAANHLLAAYFKVSGPLGNPRVVPMPITSVAHFFTYILKLPISILQGVGQGVSGGGNGGGINKGGGGGTDSGVGGPPSN
jgi:hypothetical protein